MIGNWSDVSDCPISVLITGSASNLRFLFNWLYGIVLDQLTLSYTSIMRRPYRRTEDLAHEHKGSKNPKHPVASAKANEYAAEYPT